MRLTFCSLLALIFTLAIATPAFSQDCTVEYGVISASVEAKQELADIGRTYHSMTNQEVVQKTDRITLKPDLNFGAVITCNSPHTLSAKWEFPGTKRQRDVYVYQERNETSWSYAWTFNKEAVIEPSDVGRYDLTIKVDGKDFFFKSFDARQ